MELASFQTEIDSKAPSGIDLRNEPEFHALERMLDPAARTTRVSGSDAPTAADVDWTAVFDATVLLAQKGRDLRVLVVAVRALTNIDGLAGLTKGLDLMTSTLTDHWDTLHPLLRERDDPKDAALRRINCLKQLENDDNGLLGDLEMNPILTVPGIGAITGQNLCDAALTEFEAMNDAPSGLNGKERERLRAAHETNKNRVTSACRAVAAEQADLADTLKKDVVAAARALATLQSTFSDKAGLSNGTGLTFPELAEFLKRAQTMMEAGMTTTETTASAPVRQSSAAAPTTAPSPAKAASGEIQSRSDVEYYLGQIVAFYERTEPSSPIPHLARRVQRMVNMDFMELMSEVAPSGMKEFRNAAGVQDEKGK